MRRLVSALLLLLPAPALADERSFQVPTFERVRVDGPYQVVIVTGPSATARGEGDAAALDRLDVHVDGTTLTITANDNAWGGGASPSIAKVYLRTPLLRAIAVNGGGRVTIDRMTAARVDIGLNGAGTVQVAGIAAEDVQATLTGTGAITLAGKTTRARIRSAGAGAIDGANLIAGDAVVIAESSGPTSIAGRYTVRVMALGGGDVAIGGTPECQISGPGPVTCLGKVVRK
jgi:hypothetical protein